MMPSNTFDIPSLSCFGMAFRLHFVALYINPYPTYYICNPRANIFNCVLGCVGVCVCFEGDGVWGDFYALAI